jgi:hypothetical protein
MIKKILLISFIFISCNKEKDLTYKKYFDLRGFSESILQKLEKQKPKVTKTWQIGSQKETKVTEKIDWKKELSLFVESDLNKKAFINSYIISETKNTISYDLKKEEALSVKKLKIENLPKKNSKRISISSSTSNYLFRTNSEIAMTVINGNLSEYSIYTIQKLFLSKSDTSIIKGKINSL